MIELTLAVIGAATVLRWALAVYRALSADRSGNSGRYGISGG
ncbi:MAG: hypothetical protein ACLPOA_16345 [Methylocella sp.]|jgi:hypothetical protein